MDQKRYGAQQASFLARDVPLLSEGYYSSGPNPNLRRFIEEHSTPYDPATDGYDVAAFDQPIVTTKATAIYNIHPYWSKKPHGAIRQYIRHYTQQGDLVLDPFCGSGGTALAALIEGRAIAAIDLSPAATFITSASLQFAFPDALSDALLAVTREMTPFVQRHCTFPITGEFIRAVVYTERFRCSRCFQEVPFIRAVAGETRNFRGRNSEKECCPHCGEPINTNKDKRLGFVPAELFLSRTSSSRQTRVLDVLGDKVCQELYPAHPKDIPTWLQIPFDGYIPPRLSKNIAKAGVHVAGELFSDLNLRILLELRDVIDRTAPTNEVRQLLKLALHAILYNSTRMYRYRTKTAGGGGFSGTYYVPHLSKCINPWTAFHEKCESMQTGLEEIRSSLITSSKPRSSAALVSTESATRYNRDKRIPNDCVDYIFTDPPYGGTYHYGALNFLWEVWEQSDLSWRPKEIVISEDGSITFEDWVTRMRQALEEMYSVLKPGRWISLCFHGEVELWSALHDIVSEVGFLSENRDSVLYVDTGQKSYNQLTGSSSKKRDLVINFRKPRRDELSTEVILSGDEDLITFSDKARTILREALEEHPGSPADRLYDELVSRTIRKGQFERHDFEALLRSVGEDPHADNHWYSVETADQADKVESAKEAFVASHLEAFMARYLAQHPEEDGVHYSDLLEQYLPVKDKPRRLPLDWLPEFFFKTMESTWRPPANDEERAQKEALRTTGILRRIKRFGRALLEGVPPHDRDRPPNVATAADWIRQSRRAGLYDIGRALYEKGGFRFEELGEEGKMEVEEDYRICVRRAG